MCYPPARAAQDVHAILRRGGRHLFARVPERHYALHALKRKRIALAPSRTLCSVDHLKGTVSVLPSVRVTWGPLAA
jgi:hypothetical protein